MQPFEPPQLSNDDKQRLLQARTAIQNCRAFIKQCEDAGLDCTDYVRQCEQLETLANGLIRTFVNPRRRG